MPARPNSRSDARTYRGRTLDVALREDPRNEAFRMEARFGHSVELPLQSRVWDCPIVLDQGKNGACVGYAGAHFYASEASPQEVDSRIARRFYKQAQKHDEWPGESYSGTSVNGLLKYLRSQNMVGEYRWIRTWDELERTLAHYGPVIVGCQWREECFHPDAQGNIDFDGPVQGGHATCWRGIDYERERIVIQQSWGRSHGDGGTVYMSFSDVKKLLRTHPQIAFPEKRALRREKLKPAKRWWQFWR